jgi:hypothetical protein
MCAEMLKSSVADRAGEVGVEVLLPALRGAIRREVARMSDRLAHLSSRGAYESAAARRLVFQLLTEEFGPEEANARNRAAWKASVESLRKPVEGLREILDEAPPLQSSEDGAASVEREALS